MKFERLCDTLHPADEEARAWLLNAQEGDTLELSEGTRTQPQNNALHLYCHRVAAALNAAGFDMKTFPYRQGIDVPWTKESVKRIFWKPTQDAMLGKESTRRLLTKEVNTIYKALDEALFQRTKVRVEFPSRAAE